MRFEDKYKNGLKNGKAKEYHKTCKLKFEGQYLYDKKIGTGKEYNCEDIFKKKKNFLKIKNME